ncbi:MAG TPA: class I SAM-dependent methyltransferase [Acidimicrobiales bacterium]|nr:class I SAM-dependent methyltransferase [Acidimicrobiales bacterium]
MNDAHLRLCASPEWASYVEGELLPWALADSDLGDDVLEIGAGPGLTTDVLRRTVARLTAVEIDDGLAAALADRLAGTNVEVLRGDATALDLPAGRFSAAACFTMLHHVPSPELQARVLAEAHRVLRPGGLFVGTDGRDTPARRELHDGDTFVPVDPDQLPARLRAVGFSDVVVETTDDRFCFRATA